MLSILLRRRKLAWLASLLEHFEHALKPSLPCKCRIQKRTMLHCRDENPHRHPRCRAHLPTGPPLLFAYGIHIKECPLCGLTFFEVSLVIFEVVAQGYSFHQVLAALEIWTSSLYGKHSLDLTQKLWLVGVLP